ncbi:MAG: hypothetical protein ACK5NK_12105 [Niabella sp.]
MLLQIDASAQKSVLSNIPLTGKNIYTFIPKGYDTLEVALGDLNKDEKPDAVLALRHQSELNDSIDVMPHRVLLILFKENDGYRLAGKSEKVLLGKDEGGVYGDPYNGIIIKNNVLDVSHYGGSSWRWYLSRKFRYQNGGFYLIGSTNDSYHISSDCGDDDDVTDGNRNYKDINYVTGEQEIIENDNHCKTIKHTKNKIRKKPLVKLEAFKYNI